MAGRTAFKCLSWSFASYYSRDADLRTTMFRLVEDFNRAEANVDYGCQTERDIVLNRAGTEGIRKKYPLHYKRLIGGGGALPPIPTPSYRSIFPTKPNGAH